jgi:hypothetical protein
MLAPQMSLPWVRGLEGPSVVAHAATHVRDTGESLKAQTSYILPPVLEAKGKKCGKRDADAPKEETAVIHSSSPNNYEVRRSPRRGLFQQKEQSSLQRDISHLKRRRLPRVQTLTADLNRKARSQRPRPRIGLRSDTRPGRRR